jgi:hypothetical protein
MKALKHIAGILLATVGILFVLASIAELVDGEAELPVWGVAVMFNVLGLLPLAGAVALLRRGPGQVGVDCCPKCGGSECMPSGALTKSQTLWLSHIFGWLFASLWGASRKKQVRCVRRETVYFTETKGTRIVGICLWVFLLLILLGVIASYFEGDW